MTRFSFHAALLSACCVLGLLFGLFSGGTDAYSSGDVPMCDAWGHYGCDPTKYRNGVQTDCRDTDAGIMDWADKPIRSAAYTVRTSDSTTPERDAKSYVPGEYMEIHVRVHERGMKYRGLLLHAYSNKLNKTVGEWIHHPAPIPAFWTNEKCPKAVMHAHADEKPYHHQFGFVAPGPGNGSITFRTLIKWGPANTGKFFYPLNDLVLQEREQACDGGTCSVARGSSHSGKGWYKAPKGVTCDDFCADLDPPLECNAEKMMFKYGPQLTEAAATGGIICNPNPARDCSMGSPAIDIKTGDCFYHPTDCSEKELVATPNGADQPSSATPCSGASPTFHHLCVCGSGFRNAPSLWLLLALVGGAFGLAQEGNGGFRSPMLKYLLFGLVALNVLSDSTVQAHNWMHSPARNNMIARAGRTCDRRKDSDTHAQVGPGQDFVVQWATGHNRDTVLVILDADDETWTQHKDYLKMVNDYLDKAPAGSSIHMDPKYRRRHGATSNARLEAPSPNNEGQMNPFASMLDPDHEHNLHAPNKDATRQFFYEFKDDAIQSDLYVAYDSEEYPWIVGAHRYEHQYSLGGDYDAVRVQIPGHRCPKDKLSCHYVVHWYWSGYSDCVDVDYFHEPVENIYGVPGEISDAYDLVDHCEYVNPLRRLTTCRVIENPPQPVTVGYNNNSGVLSPITVPGIANVSQCVEDLENHYYMKRIAFRGVPGGGVSWRFGVQTMPVRPPASVAFPEGGLEWHRSYCANNDHTLIEGEESTNMRDWKQWLEDKVDVQPVKVCKEPQHRQNMTIYEAASLCTMDHMEVVTRQQDLDPSVNADMPRACHGFSFSDASTHSYSSTGSTWIGTGGSTLLNTLEDDIFEITFCDTAELVDAPDQTYQAFMKKASGLPAMPRGTGPVIKVSFQKDPGNLVHAGGDSGYGSGAANEYVVETGELYGVREGLRKYGYNCKSMVIGYGDAATVEPPLSGGWVTSVESTYVRWGADRTCTVSADVDVPTDGPTGVPKDTPTDVPAGEKKTTRDFWQIDVPTGIYQVEMLNERGDKRDQMYQEIQVEGVRYPLLRGRGGRGNPEWASWKATFVVEVLDGALTLQAIGNRITNNPFIIVNQLIITRLADVGTQTPAWVPVTENAWWQKKLPTTEEVGLVEITLPGPNEYLYCGWDCYNYGPFWRSNFHDCRSWWLFQHATCGLDGGLEDKQTQAPAGPFTNRDTEGAVVVVSSRACTASGCPKPTEEEICGYIEHAPSCGTKALQGQDNIYVGDGYYIGDRTRTWVNCPIEVDCKGKKGRYVRIQLPGPDRAVAFEVKVNRAFPKVPENTLACYGLEAALAQPLPIPTSEFEVSDDPEDLKFYSSCYSRNPVVIWQPTGNEPPPREPQYKYGNKCLSCDSFAENENMEYNITLLQARSWVIDPKCQNCLQGAKALGTLEVERANSESGDILAITGVYLAGEIFLMLLFTACMVGLCAVGYKYDAGNKFKSMTARMG